MSLRICVAGMCVVGWLMAGAAHAQDDALSKALNLTAADRSVPLWAKSKGEAVDMSSTVKTLQPAIFLVGAPDRGYGTAFVVSKKHRLLVTNAHVADIRNAAGGKLFAIQNGTARLSEVTDVYYHPGVRRLASGVSVRATDPSRGPVDPASPDMALLRLREGADLPDALPLAPPESLDDLLAKPLGMIGFPGHDTVAWPALGANAEGTFRQGVVCRLTDYGNDAQPGGSRRQYLQHSLASWFGFSGAPLFLADGRVVGVNNSARSISRNGLTTSVAYGVRIDCLWELAKHHALHDELETPPSARDLDLTRYSAPDAQADTLAEAEDLLARAAIDLGRNAELEAIAKCDEAVRKMPLLAVAHSKRGLAHNRYAIKRTSQGSSARKRYYDLAIQDARRAMQLDPSNPHYYLSYAIGLVNVTNARNNDRAYLYCEESLQIADKLLKEAELDLVDRMFALRIRAIARGYPRDSLADLQTARDMSPTDSDNYWALHWYWKKHGRSDVAADMMRKHDLYLSAESMASEAARLATSPVVANRDGRRALELARKACDLCDQKSFSALQALAAAHAERGEFDEAIERQTAAAALADLAGRDAALSRLHAYRQQRPWREAE